MTVLLGFVVAKNVSTETLSCHERHRYSMHWSVTKFYVICDHKIYGKWRYTTANKASSYDE